MRDVSTINPVSYNANIIVGQVNDAQEGESANHKPRRSGVFSGVRDSEAETEQWLLELSKYASCPIEEDEVPHFKHLLQVMGLSLVRVKGGAGGSGQGNSVSRGDCVSKEGASVRRGNRKLRNLMSSINYDRRSEEVRGGSGSQ
ncbi:hypothetical protein ACSBR2_034384 [Camellia fascicularis]